MTIADRVPPQNLTAEQAVLGSVLVDRSMLDVVAGIVRPSDFYAHIHETIFSAMLHLAELQAPIDKISLGERLRTAGTLEKVGGIAYLSVLMDTVPTAASAEYFATIVREKAMLRETIAAGTRITQLGYEGEEDPIAAVSEAESVIRAVANRGVAQSAGETVAAVSSRLFRALDAKLSGDSVDVAQRTPWEAVNLMTGGFFPSEMVAWAGAPGTGKTVAVLMVADFTAAHYGAVAHFSLEMTKDASVRRYLAMYSGVTARRQRLAEDLRLEDMDRLGRAMSTLASRPIFLFGRETSRLAEIKRAIQAIKKRQHLAAVVVDHAGFIADVDARGSDKTSKHERLDNVYRALLRMADEEQFVLHIVQHLSRAGAEGRPSLHHLRDGGNLEGHTSIAILLYRPHPDGDRDQQKLGEFIIAKARDGEPGSVKMHFEGARNLWLCDHPSCGCKLVPWFQLGDAS